MYLQKTAPGPAIDDDEKLGRQVSTLHLTLWQGGQVLFWTMLSPQKTAAAMMPAVPNFNLLKTVGTDGVWVKGLLPNDLIRKGSPEH
ncbi:hypothetical protein E4U10_004765 [Claviceps purpurea]|nr:hypothetical protein E4U10_004765 [Claviceps purpurea]